MKKFVVIASTLACLSTTLPMSAGAQAFRADPGVQAQTGLSPIQVQYYRRGYYGRGRGYGGAGVAAGIAGLAAGAIIGGAIASQAQPAPVYGGPPPGYEGDPVAYCMSRFKSYDPGSGTYLGFDGYRHPCP